MAHDIVRFSYLTGSETADLPQRPLVRETGPERTLFAAVLETPMSDIIGEDGCPGFARRWNFDESELGNTFSGRQPRHAWGH